MNDSELVNYQIENNNMNEMNDVVSEILEYCE